MTGRLLRGAAVALAVAGVGDPACEVRSAKRPALSVEIVDTASLALPADGGGTRRDRAEQARQMLAERLAKRFDVVSGPVSSAPVRVVIGDAPPDVDLGSWRGAPGPAVHAVNVSSPLSPNARIVRAGVPRRITLWDSAAVAATVEGYGLAGQEAVVRLFENDVELASTTHTWRGNPDSFEARLTFVPPSAGPHRLEVRVSSGGAERTELDNRVSLLVEAEAVRRRVLVYQPRLSWMAAFVARALARDPRVELSSRARASSGVEISSGALPTGFDAFDAVAVGAPDALTRSEAAALMRYVTARGGSVIILADRRPSGPSLALSPAESFDDVLLDEPVALAPGLRASELSVARGTRAGWEALAAAGERPVLFATPRGRGHIVFSGALDAWRFRDGSRYWQDLVLAFAAKAPPRVWVRVEPPVARPGEPVEVQSNAGRARLGGETLRLWPGGEPGLFRGSIRAPGAAGTVAVSAEHEGVRAEATLAIDPAAAHPWPDRARALEPFAAAHGGLVVAASDMAPLLSALDRAAGPEPTVRTLRPMRSGWWMAPFVSLLAAEWTLRRRRHLH